MITDDPSFSECRMLMLQLRRTAGGQTPSGPCTEGVIWLRDFTPRSQKGFEGVKGLGAITPTRLKEAIQIQLGSTGNGLTAINPIPIAFLSLQENRSILEQVWPELYMDGNQIRRSGMYADPDRVFGFFLSYIHKSSDNFILSVFHARLH